MPTLDDPISTATWFESSVIYSGRATVELENPRAKFTGTFEYKTLPYSATSLQIRVDKGSIQPAAFRGDPFSLFEQMEDSGPGWRRFIPFERMNPCARIVLETQSILCGPRRRATASLESRCGS